jgi:hypothetical protein
LGDETKLQKKGGFTAWAARFRVFAGRPLRARTALGVRFRTFLAAFAQPMSFFWF